MARLLLLRHAKSSQDDPVLADFARPLAPRGERDAAQMGRLLAARGFVPDRILCSSALRTRQTLARLVLHLPGEPRIEFLDDLYHASRADYVRVIAANGAKARTLMVVGHNPMMQDAALRLVGTGDPQSASELGAKFPTAAVAVIDFDFAGWNVIGPGAGHLAAFLIPGED